MINIGTFVLLLMMIYILFSSKTIKKIYSNFIILTVVVELMIERGYFIQIGNQQIAYRTVCELVLAVVSLIIIICNKGIVSKKSFSLYVSLLVCLLLGWFLLLIFPTNARGGNLDVSWDFILTGKADLQRIVFTNSMIMEMVQILIYIICGITMYSFIGKNDWFYICCKIVYFLRAILYFNTIEILTKYFIKSNIYSFIVDFILGKSIATDDVLGMRGKGFVLCGLTKEASHYSFVLSVILIINFICYYMNKQKENKKKINKDIVAIIITILTMILSMSFSSIYYLGCIVLFDVCLVSEKKGNSLVKMWVIIAISIIILYVSLKLLPTIAAKMSIVSFWGRRIASLSEEFTNVINGNWLTQSTALEWSNRVRIGSTYETFRLVKYRPLFGLGLAATSAHSSLAMLVSGCGIIGTICYIKAMFGVNKVNKNNGLYYSFIIVFLALTLFSSVSLRPFYEIWSIVLVNYLWLFIDGRKEISCN